MKERLQKIIARSGICSRRKAEELIKVGKVRVNGKTVTFLGTEADPETDRILVEGKPLREERKVYYLLNKPPRVITTVHDPAGRRTVMHYFPAVRERIFPVGRLDYLSEGLLLMTNDGKLDYLLTHPRHEVEKVYEVTVRGKFSDTLAKTMETGVHIDSGKTAPCEIEILSYDKGKNKTFLRMTLHEGKNREIRKMMEKYRYPVFALKRVEYDFLTLRGLERGKSRRLTREEVKRLYDRFR
ncbi:MAG: pseudouridine synthase [Dialister sp.]|nr:pseudouridine synthase [Dialister sp.]